jgi:hypothetical protein
MPDDTPLDTVIQEPSMTAGETETAVLALERCRALIAWKCGGLDAIGLHRCSSTWRWSRTLTPRST